MSNRMKNTICIKCGKDLNNTSYAGIMVHIAKHKTETIDTKNQTGLDEFIHK